MYLCTDPSPFFKGTDRNLFIPTDSCHFNPWLRSVPKSQYMRLRRNCSDPGEFLVQAEVLTTKFLDKVYQQDFLVDTLVTVKTMNRADLLVEREPRVDGGFNMDVPFVTSYSLQHKSIKQLVSKHWHIVNNDVVLKGMFPDKSRVIFRGVPSLRNRVVPNVLDPPTISRGFLDQLSGFYKCGSCRVCSLSLCTQRCTTFVSTATRKPHTIKPCITCSTVGVVYMLQCPCGLQYVGQTKRPLQVRLNEHITNIKIGFKNHSVSKHYLLTHNKDPFPWHRQI